MFVFINIIYTKSMKLKIFLIALFAGLLPLKSQSLNNLPIITPSQLPYINSNIEVNDSLNNRLYLFGNEIKDDLCISGLESEIISYALSNLAVHKYGSWSSSRFTPLLTDSLVDKTQNLMDRFLQAVNITQNIGIPKYEYEDLNSNLIKTNDEYLFNAALNTSQFSRLSSANNPEMIKEVLDRGYPVIIYFKVTQDFKKAMFWAKSGIETDKGKYYWGFGQLIVGVDYSKSINSISNNSEYAMAVLVGYNYDKIFDNSDLKFSVFYPFVDEFQEGDRVTYKSGYTYMSRNILDSNMIDYAIIPHNLSSAKMPSLEGNDTIICQQEYKINDFPNEASVNWASSGLLRITSGQNTPNILVRPYEQAIAPNLINSSSSIHPSIDNSVTASISYRNLIYNLKKELTVIPNIAPILSNKIFYINVNSNTTFTIDNLPDVDASQIKWTVKMPKQLSPIVKYGKSITIKSRFYGKVHIKIENLKGCEPKNTSNYTFNVISIATPIFNNPSKDLLQIKMVKSSSEINVSTRSFSDDLYYGEYKLELYDKNTILRRSIITESDNPTPTISLEGLEPGVYFLRLIIGGELINVYSVIVKF